MSDTDLREPIVHQYPDRLPRSVDVLVIGSGAAGSCAALELGRRGIRTLVVESTQDLGGAAALSGGGCCIAGSPLQHQLGIDDDVEKALADWSAWGGAGADLAWARMYLTLAVEDIFEWARALGVRWERVQWFEGNSVPRWHQPHGGGARLMELIRQGCAGAPVSWVTGTPVTELVADASGQVREVRVLADQQVMSINTQAVIVATGGFTGDPAEVDRHIKPAELAGQLLCGGAPGARGAGHEMLSALGAQFAGLDQIWTYPYATVDIRDASQRRGLAVRGLRNDVWIDASGRRFHNEALRGGATGTPAILKLTPPTCWSVFDSQDAATLTLSHPQFGQEGSPNRHTIADFLAASPYAHQAETLDELARQCGLPYTALAGTVKEFNDAVRGGLAVDPLGRELSGLREISQPPFHAVQFFPMARKNLGGVLTDMGCRVLRVDGTPYDNVFAAGEVAGMAGGRINGSSALEGTMLGPSLFAGRVAAREAAALLERTSSGDNR
jgi:predicted oxidoreductase